MRRMRFAVTSRYVMGHIGGCTIENRANVAFCRHEGALRDRSLDLKEAAAVTRYTIMQDGTQGMFQYCFLRAFIRYEALAVLPSSHPFRSPSRLCNRALPNTLPLRILWRAGRGAGERIHICTS